MAAAALAPPSSAAALIFTPFCPWGVAVLTFAKATLLFCPPLRVYSGCSARGPLTPTAVPERRD
jgi:hypothetical protein